MLISFPWHFSAASPADADCIALLGLVLVVGGVAVVGAAIYQHLDGERQYRRLLTDGERSARAGNSYGAIEAFSGALAFRPQSDLTTLLQRIGFTEISAVALSGGIATLYDACKPALLSPVSQETPVW